MEQALAIKAKLLEYYTAYGIPYYHLFMEKGNVLVHNPIFIVIVGFIVFVYLNYLIIKHMGENGLYIAVVFIVGSFVVL